MQTKNLMEMEMKENKKQIRQTHKTGSNTNNQNNNVINVLNLIHQNIFSPNQYALCMFFPFFFFRSTKLLFSVASVFHFGCIDCEQPKCHTNEFTNAYDTEVLPTKWNAFSIPKRPENPAGFVNCYSCWYFYSVFMALYSLCVR